MSQSNSDDKKSDTKNTENSETAGSNNEDIPTIDPTEKWLIRDCEIYEDEYDECTSFKARFHQYFIYGKSLDCNQWKKDFVNCRKWVDDNDARAADALIKSEKARRMERLRAHYQNDVWKKRDGPPADWAKPLPDWMIERDKNTYLAQKAQEIREGTETETKSFCAIM